MGHCRYTFTLKRVRHRDVACRIVFARGFNPESAMSRSVRIRHLLLPVLAAAALAGCVTSPASAARQAQQLNDIGDQLNELRTENATLESVVDSLRTVIAKHDTTLTRLGGATGVAVVK
jgi:outer membrane murein-binding lipoprotein Lpp